MSEGRHCGHCAGPHQLDSCPQLNAWGRIADDPFGELGILSCPACMRGRRLQDGALEVRVAQSQGEDLATHWLTAGLEEIGVVPVQKLPAMHAGDCPLITRTQPGHTHESWLQLPAMAGEDYDVDPSLGEWLDLLAEVLAECWRVLVPGGRIAVNVAGAGRRPYLPLHHRVSELLVDLGFWLRGEIVWEKVGTGGASCAWGSWRSASNPSLRDVHEYVIVASKGSAKLPRTEFAKQTGREDTISRDEFMEATRSIWRLRSAQASRVGHPAPFPVELPRRLIELLSFRGDTVLDPFVGSGSTAIAARDVERHFVGVDISPKYVQLARERLGAPAEEEE